MPSRKTRNLKARHHAASILGTIDELEDADDLLDQTMQNVTLAFDRACERWRGLYQVGAETGAKAEQDPPGSFARALSTNSARNGNTARGAGAIKTADRYPEPRSIRLLLLIAISPPKASCLGIASPVCHSRHIFPGGVRNRRTVFFRAPVSWRSLNLARARSSTTKVPATRSIR